MTNQDMPNAEVKTPSSPSGDLQPSPSISGPTPAAPPKVTEAALPANPEFSGLEPGNSLVEGSLVSPPTQPKPVVGILPEDGPSCPRAESGKVVSDVPSCQPVGISAAGVARSSESENDLGDDLQVLAHLVVRSKTGVIWEMKPNARLSFAGQPAMLVQALEEFNAFLEQFLVKPAKIKFNEHIQPRKPGPLVPVNEKSLVASSGTALKTPTNNRPQFPSPPPPKQGL